MVRSRICLAECARPVRSSVQIITRGSKTDARALLEGAAHELHLIRILNPEGIVSFR